MDIKIDKLAVSGHPHFLSGLSASICTSKQRLKLLGKQGAISGRTRWGWEHNPYFSTCPKRSTIIRKISKLSIGFASGVTAEANWYPQYFSEVCCCSHLPRSQFLPSIGLRVQHFTLFLSKPIWKKACETPAPGHGKLTGLAWTVHHSVSIIGKASVAFFM